MVKPLKECATYTIWDEVDFRNNSGQMAVEISNGRLVRLVFIGRRTYRTKVRAGDDLCGKLEDMIKRVFYALLGEAVYYQTEFVHETPYSGCCYQSLGILYGLKDPIENYQKEND